MIQEWEIVERRLIFNQGLYRIEEKTVRSPRGGPARQVQAIHFADWVVVLPITPQGDVIMVRQYRHGVEAICLELPGGLIDPGDGSPEAAAKRELAEETGYGAGEFVGLGSCYPQPAILDCRCYFVLARDAAPAGPPRPDEGEEIEVVRRPLVQIPDLIRNGAIAHGMVQLAFYAYWLNRPAVPA
jgi:ADP-ribose pyrophosphatase